MLSIAGPGKRSATFTHGGQRKGRGDADRKIAKPPVRFENVAGTKLRRVLTPDKKKYAGYFHALTEHAHLEKKWHNEDQRNLHRLINIRKFLWT
jgi:hypothetical protein